MKANKGYIYILTNPSFPDWVKIGYADDPIKRVEQLNRTECTPFAFSNVRSFISSENSLASSFQKMILLL